MPQLIGDGVVVFAGLSMTDPNLVSACYRLGRDHPHPRYVLLVDEYAYPTSVSAEAESEVKELTYRRLEDMGLYPIRLVSYGQVAQLLYEAAIRRSVSDYWDDSSATRYGKRLSRWRERVLERYPIQQKFDDVQEEFHQRLHTAARQIRDEDLRRLRKPGEEFGIHLWVRRPGKRLGELELWASSSNVHREYWSMDKQVVPVERNTGVAAADAVYNGAAQIRPASDIEFSRWQATIALPIELSEPPWNNIIVGAITLSSTFEYSDSGLGRLRNEAYHQLVSTVQTLGVELLTP